MCQEYYNQADDVNQKIHLTSLIQKVPVVRKLDNPISKNRQTSRVYYLKNSAGETHRVCLKFFCGTFAISHRVVENCANGMSANGLYIGRDKRIGVKPPNVTPSDTIQLVKDHIDSFPRIESHYCRRDSQKQYLSPDLNISKMYRLYKNDFCMQKNVQAVSLFVYQKTFHEYDPRLDFYKPKKDQCSLCNSYNIAKDKGPLQEDYNNHKQREKDDMQMKADDKQRSRADEGKTFRSISFDMQAILPIPHAGDNQIYYKHKLNVYNFTIYDTSNSDGHCFVWDETHGNKGSVEIGSCLLKYLMNLPETVTHVASFSDTCSGQNRNKFVTAAMLYAVNKIDNLKIIDLKFMETGHSYLEADSMHSTIERAKRHKKIYSTREWCLLISTARLKPREYYVTNMKFTDFFDLQKLVEDNVFNTTLNTNNEKVNWLRIKWLRFQKETPNIVQYKYNLTEESFFEIDISSNKRKQGRKKKWESIILNRKYTSRLPISQKKKKDLVFLLEKKVIPEDYENFIKEIPQTKEPTVLNASDLENSD
uniref:Uncharacterized protein LOC114344462 n=1 Tax=Diabrotica virgifera virgifera TaxID=50390 RepID=A0A6P7GN78_DIAVI